MNSDIFTDAQLDTAFYILTTVIALAIIGIAYLSIKWDRQQRKDFNERDIF